MITGWNEFERSLSMLDDVRRRMDQLWSEFDGSQRSTPLGTSWPPVNVFDSGEAIRVTAELPGLSEGDVTVTMHNDLLTLQGERRVASPSGYIAHRQERPSVRFSRSVAMPCKVDVERVAAKMIDGVLTIVLPKAAESRPRQIAVSPGT